MSEEQKEKPRPAIIDATTLMPVGFVVLLMAGVIRVETTSYKANANEEKIIRLELENKEYQKVITEVRISLTQIKTTLGIKDEVQKPDSR